MKNDARKREVLKFINVADEVAQLIGRPKNGKYQCYNTPAHKNGDKDPSLTMDQDGNYACHSCGVKGDFFQLYMARHNLSSSSFYTVLEHFEERANIIVADGDKRYKDTPKTVIKNPVINRTDANEMMLQASKAIFSDYGGRATLDWLQECYGITSETVEEYGLGYDSNSKRLLIPIPVGKVFQENGRFGELLNIRKHDIHRYHCKWIRGEEEQSKRPAEVDKIRGEWNYGGWTPAWKGRGGKVIGVKGHNKISLYPNAAMEEPSVWIVAGELKALLLRQFGINAVCMTAGENNWSGHILDLFKGKEVRVVYDVDRAGIEGAKKIAQELANRGAVTFYGEIPPEGLPEKGDITDYMRKNAWHPECLNAISFTKVKAEVINEAPKKKLDGFDRVDFDALIDGKYFGKNVQVEAVISGRGTDTFAVPKCISARCVVGEQSKKDMCKACSLPRNGFASKGFPKAIELAEERVVDMTGLPKKQIKKIIKLMLGIPEKCNSPKINVENASVERMMIAPSISSQDSDYSTYRHHYIYNIVDSGKSVMDNEEYWIDGRIVGDPKNNSYTMAAVRMEEVKGNVFTFEPNTETTAALREALWGNCSSPGHVIAKITRDLGDNVLYKFGVDSLILVELMSWFMPFKFSVGKYNCDKACPEIMCLGDTRVGKSTIAKQLREHFGVGRYVDCGGKTTFVGLIGGNDTVGSRQIFRWGIIPLSKGSQLVMDESNKLSTGIWGEMTNIRSSGIASRITNTGVRTTPAHTRFLYLANPRTGRLSSYENPLVAAIEILGEPQDLARLDLLFVIPTLDDPTIVNQDHDPDTEHLYTNEIARYHLSWAWSLTEDRILFEDHRHVLRRAELLIKRLRGLPIIAPPEAKFKIGRVAIALASICYSADSNGRLLVLNSYVDMAFSMLLSMYEPYVSKASIKTGMIPVAVLDLFDKVRDVLKLRILATSDVWTQSDFETIFMGDAENFKRMAQLEYNLMRRSRSNFIPAEGFSELIQQYVTEKLKEMQG